MPDKKGKEGQKPRIVFGMSKPGQSMEDFKLEMAAKHPGIALEDTPGDPDKMNAILEQMGMSIEDLEELAEKNVKDKRLGLFQKIENALLN